MSPMHFWWSTAFVAGRQTWQTLLAVGAEWGIGGAFLGALWRAYQTEKSRTRESVSIGAKLKTLRSIFEIIVAAIAVDALILCAVFVYDLLCAPAAQVGSLTTSNDLLQAKVGTLQSQLGLGVRYTSSMSSPDGIHYQTNVIIQTLQNILPAGFRITFSGPVENCIYPSGVFENVETNCGKNFIEYAFGAPPFVAAAPLVFSVSSDRPVQVIGVQQIVP